MLSSIKKIYNITVVIIINNNKNIIHFFFIFNHHQLSSHYQFVLHNVVLSFNGEEM